MRKQLPRIVVVCGSTATGKSDLAVEIALQFNGEVISADSRQVYTSLDIGSGKITAKEMKGVPHHLLDVSDPSEHYNVEQFNKDGKKAIAHILSKGKLPIVCGGTGFYIDALVFDESFPDVPPNAALRKELSSKDLKELLRMIHKLDPRRAKELDPHNKIRIIRAIEIAKALGKVPRTKRQNRYETLFIGLTADRDKLKERIHQRLIKRMEEGMVHEVEALRNKGVTWKRFHELGLEYRYIALFLRKKMTLDEMLTKLEFAIIHFAKRQMTWFKRNRDIHWLLPGSTDKALAIVKKFLSK